LVLLTATVPLPSVVKAGVLEGLEQVPLELQLMVPVAVVAAAGPPGQPEMLTEVVLVKLVAPAQLEAAEQAEGASETEAWLMLPLESHWKVEDQPQLPPKSSATVEVTAQPDWQQPIRLFCPQVAFSAVSFSLLPLPTKVRSVREVGS
jgi:hypothetical protein